MNFTSMHTVVLNEKASVNIEVIQRSGEKYGSQDIMLETPKEL